MWQEWGNLEERQVAEGRDEFMGNCVWMSRAEGNIRSGNIRSSSGCSSFRSSRSFRSCSRIRFRIVEQVGVLGVV